MKKVTKKTAFDIKQASNQKLTPTARKHYAENAQAAMKNKKKKLKSIFHYLKDFRLISKTSKKSTRKKVKISSNLPMNHLSKIS